MNSIPNQNTSTRYTDDKFMRVFYANSRYNPLFLGVAGIGFAVIHLLTLFNVLGSPSSQLLYISGALLLTAILHIPGVRLARNHKGIAASFLSTFSISLLAVLLTSFWQGILPLAIIVALIMPLTSILAGLPRRFYVPLLLVVIASIAAILYVNTSPLFVERLQTSTPAAIAGLAFFGATGLLLFTVTVIARGDTYRSLRAQLLASFAITAQHHKTLLIQQCRWVRMFFNCQNPSSFGYENLLCTVCLQCCSFGGPKKCPTVAQVCDF